MTTVTSEVAPALTGPRRTCIGCRRVAGPADLVRVARRPDGAVVIGRREPGRGAWLCAAAAVPLGLRAVQLAHSEKAEPVCFDKAVRREAFRRALRCEVGGYVIDRLRAELVLDGGVSRSGAAGPEVSGPTGAGDVPR